MNRLTTSLMLDHHLSYVALAALVCVCGSCLTIMTMRRLVTATGPRKRIQLTLGSLIMGATIWSTHFIAMLAYDPGVMHGYVPSWTALSLIIAILGSFVSNALMAYGMTKRNYGLSGAAFGITISVMHYVGMSAYLLPGEIVWQTAPVVLSVLLGAVLGAACYHRIAYPITRYCWLGGAAFMVLAICAVHFIGMTAIDLALDPTVAVPAQLLSDSILSTFILSVVALILFVGFAAISIETNLEREAIQHLEHTVAHDHLTGLPNRFRLKQEFDQLQEKLKTAGFNVAVVSIDLKLFKQINDLHGNDMGDVVLSRTACRLKAALDDGEFVARVGGDEFIAIMTDCVSNQSALQFAQKLFDAITPAIIERGQTMTISASLGVATTIDEKGALGDLMTKSDLALFRAKQQTDRDICLYDAEMDQQIAQKLILTNDLRFAEANNQFEIVYQLQNDTHSKEAFGCEALLRWNHPTKGLISPVVFIPLAEETGLIQDIGLWVLRTACFEAASWTKPWSIAVNVAPQQLSQSTFVDNLTDILTQSGLPPERLELEVTEASVIHDQAYALKVLRQIKEIGVRIAMDDFGTGYSSMATLQTFPFDKIKIDRSFITDLHQNPRRAAIVRSTLSLGEAFGIPVLAEGVESEDELAFLVQEGCAFVQGFYFGKPMTLDAIRALTVDGTLNIAS